MIRTLVLEDFEMCATGASAPAPAPTPVAAPEPPQGVKAGPTGTEDPDAAAGTQEEPDNRSLDAFEQGYQSGWDDCIANEQDERRRIGADLADALTQVSATAEGARSEIIAGLVPLLEEIAERLLPALAREALVPILIEEISGIAEELADVSISILASDDTCARIEGLRDHLSGVDYSLVAEPAFAPGQVSLRFASRRRDIDLGETVERMSAAIRAFAQDLSQARPGEDTDVRGAA